MNISIPGMFILLFIILSGCTVNSPSSDIPDSVLNVINAAGKNKSALLKVINHYQKEPLKLKAAYYLIENVANQYHYEGDGVTEQKIISDNMDSLSHTGHIITAQSWDSIRSLPRFASRISAPIHPVSDKDVISSAFLIKNIDNAFVSWQYPWAKSLSFDQFCEYILPYKVLDENMDDWREKCQKKYQWTLRLFKHCTDPRIVCSRINDTLKTEFDVSGRGVNNRFDVTYNDLVKIRTGVCDDATQYTTYVMRAMGLPVSIDYSLFWANKNSGHSWNCLMYNGKSIPFAGCESNPGETKVEFTKDKWVRRKSAKIFRHCFHNEIAPSELPSDLKEVYNNLSLNTKIKDVTSEYTDVGNVRLRVYNNPPNQKYIYLCVFNNLGWHPVYYSKINWFVFADFKDMAKDIVYMPMCIAEGERVPVGDPFVFKKDGVKQVFLPDMNHKITVFLKSKYPEDRYEEDKANNIIPGEHYELFYWDNNWLSLGKQTAREKILCYKNVPDNALLWLRDLDKGKQERIFTYKSNNQIWW